MSSGTNAATTQADEAEFAEIMGELEKLQKEVDTGAASGPTASASATPTATTTEAPTQKPDLKVVASNPEPMAVAAPQQIQDFHAGSSDDAALEETLGSFKDEEENEDSLFAEDATDDEDHVVGSGRESMVAPAPRRASSRHDTGADGALTMTLSGAMRLELRYAVSDQSVVVSFEEQILRIEMHDGTEFKVPFHKKTK